MESWNKVSPDISAVSRATLSSTEEETRDSISFRDFTISSREIAKLFSDTKERRGNQFQRNDLETLWRSLRSLSYLLSFFPMDSTQKRNYHYEIVKKRMESTFLHPREKFRSLVFGEKEKFENVSFDFRTLRNRDETLRRRTLDSRFLEFLISLKAQTRTLNVETLVSQGRPSSIRQVAGRRIDLAKSVMS